MPKRQKTPVNCGIINILSIERVIKMNKKILGVKAFTAAAGLIFSFAGGFVFSGTTIAGVASFADIALAGALSLPFSIAVFMGAVIRCVLTDSVGKCIVKLGAMSVIVIGKMFSKKLSMPIGSGIVTAVSVLLSGTAVSWLIGEFPEKLLFYSLYGIIAGFTSFAAAELFDGFSQKRVIDVSGSGGCLWGVVYIVFSASLCAIDIPAVDIGLVVISAVTALAAYFYRSLGGVVCGALGASGAFLASVHIGTAAAVLPVAGLLMGFISRGRILISAVFFALSCFMFSVLIGEASSPELTLSIVCGSALFIIAAPHYSEKWLVISGDSPKNSIDINEVRQNFLSDAIEAVRRDSGRISEALAASADEKNKEVIQKNKVCGTCYRRSICRGELSETAGEVIPILPEDCIRKKEAADELERELRMRTARRLMDLRYSDERRLLTEQLKITAELVRSSGEQGKIRHSPPISARIEETLKNHGIKFIRITAGYTVSNRLTIEIFFETGEIPESSERICGLLSDTLGIRLSSAASVSSAKELKMGLYEPPTFDLEVYSAAVCAAGSQLSGDSSSAFSDSLGVRYIVLSDGMGSGKSAAVDSHMVIGLFRRLICSGMKPESAVRMVNSVMVTKSREESFATLDAVMIDLDSCVMTSVKSGAAPTIIRRGDNVIKLSSPVFPIGIVEEAEICVSEQNLSEGDIIIMFSDGITENAYLYIKELLLRGGSVQDIVREITVKADVFNPNIRSDDVTVIGVKIVKK